MPATFPVRILFFALVLGMVGCASTSEPQSVPPDSNRADSTATDTDNPFIQAYVSRNLPSTSLQHDASEPKVYRGEDQADDNQRMLEKGYDMLGYSEFMAGPDIRPDLALQHAKKINAELVLVYTRLAGEVPLSVKLQQLRDQAKNQDGSGAVQPQASYTYFASYWAKLTPPVLGVHVMSPVHDETSPGVMIIAVIDGSPAAKAGLHEGDILTRMGDIPLKNPENLTDAARYYAGQKTELDLQRGQNTLHIPVQLNAQAARQANRPPGDN